MLLEKALKERRLADLKEFLSFWNGSGVAPTKTDKLVPILVEQMTNESQVRKRLKLLSKKLIEILKFFLRSDAHVSNLRHILNSQAFSYMSQYEMEAALNALQKRGFLFPKKVRKKKGAQDAQAAGEPPWLLIPKELGEILQNFLWDEEKDLYDTFSLKGFLSKFSLGQLDDRLKKHFKKTHDGSTDLESLLKHLLADEEVAYRIEGIGDGDLKNLLVRAITEFGGVLPRTLYDRIKGKLPAWNHREWKKLLEEHLLGTVRHLSLGEYGINHFDDTLVIFEEVVETYMRSNCLMDPAAFTEIKTLGVDLISDISNFLSFVSHNQIRLTLNGSIYRTAIKKVLDGFILSQKEEFGDQDIFEYIYSFCPAHRMIQRKGDRNLSLTVKGKAWDHQPLERKLFHLLSYAYEEWEPGEDPFHLPYLKKLFVEYLKGLEVNRWYDVMCLPFRCRNHYLANLDNHNIRDAFQNRYQYTQNTSMRDTVQLAYSLFQWMRNRFYLLGLVDLAYREGKVAAVRLNALGAKGLGIQPEQEDLHDENPVIVNPDFEVILFQDGNSYDLITQLDKFAVRTKSDNAYHFKITSGSVEKAVAEGLDSTQILTILSENSRVEIPQNVIYSIKEWAEKVKFVDVRPATLLKGRNKEVIDRIVQSSLLKDLIVERLSPTVLMLSAGTDSDYLAGPLEKLGVFLEGKDRKNGEPNEEA